MTRLAHVGVVRALSIYVPRAGSSYPVPARAPIPNPTAAEFVLACRGPDAADHYPYGGVTRKPGDGNEGQGSSMPLFFGSDPAKWTYAEFNDPKLNQWDGGSRRAPEKGARYALVVSFGSECCGTDEAAVRALAGIVARDSKKALGHTRGYWGKEGEVDECFTLDGLDPALRVRFVNEFRAGVARKLVDVQENATCQADR